MVSNRQSLNRFVELMTFIVCVMILLAVFSLVAAPVAQPQ